MAKVSVAQELQMGTKVISDAEYIAGGDSHGQKVGGIPVGRVALAAGTYEKRSFNRRLAMAELTKFFKSKKAAERFVQTVAKYRRN